MRVTRAELAERRVTLPPVGAAAAPTVERASILLTIWDSDGRRGRGECAPLPGRSFETLDACRQELTQLCQAGSWEVAPDGAACLQAAAGLRCAAARFAVESALLDWAGQVGGVGVAALFAAPRASIALNRVVDSRAAAQAALADGVTTWKVKIGGHFSAERALLDELRALSPTAQLRLDGNRAFSVDDERLAALSAYAPEYVEEPYDLRGATARCALPLAADESIIDADEALWRRLPSLGVGVVVCKPMLLGFAGAWRVAERAAALGLDLVVTHVWDGPIGLAAAAHFALAAPGRVRACGLARHPGLRLWPEIAVPFVGAAALHAPATSGLGCA